MQRAILQTIVSNKTKGAKKAVKMFGENVTKSLEAGPVSSF
jgi:hypothetical protein